MTHGGVNVIFIAHTMLQTKFTNCFSVIYTLRNNMRRIYSLKRIIKKR